MDHVKIVLARRLTNYQTFLIARSPRGQLTHGTTLVNDAAGRFIAPQLEEETSEVENMDSRTSKAPSTENIPLETLRSEFPFVFSRTVSGPST
jgi:hypothetical protein